jgi:prepilin-type N-terminal cleavage/methylation domain-containing protein
MIMRRETRRGRADRQAGFTILELLISLMILSFILSLIPGTLRIGQRVWETDDAFEQRDSLDTFRRYIEDRLTEALPIYQRDRTLNLRMEFTGDPGRVAFVAQASAGPAGGGMYRFDFRREEGPGERPLILQQSLFRITDITRPQQDGAAPASMQHRSLIGVTGLSFRYFGAPERGKPPQWQALWSRPDSLPDLIEMTIAVGGRRPSVERTVVQLRLGASS